jgi:hypothetical protein
MPLVKKHMHNITHEDILLAQKAWGESLIAIGQAYTEGDDYVGVTRSMLDRLYGYETDEGIVLFKPTRASKVPFRGSYASALSYFIGGDDAYPEDVGFALTPWIDVVFDNHNIYYHVDVAITMGHYFFTAASDETIRVEYTFVYVKDDIGQLKIILHHSSLPYEHDIK